MEDWNTYLKRNKLPLMIVVGCVIILNLFDNYYIQLITASIMILTILFKDKLINLSKNLKS
jgi:hypothetical protein